MVSQGQIETWANAQICNDCLSVDHLGPPPDDILWMPPPPLPVSVQALLMPNRELTTETEPTTTLIDMQCNYCSLFDANDSTATPDAHHISSQSNPGFLFLIFVLFCLSTLASLVYFSFWQPRRFKLFATQLKESVFHTTIPALHTNHHHCTLPSTPQHHQQPTESCVMPMNFGKTISSPNIITDVPHKKTSISSKYWQQSPGTPINGPTDQLGACQTTAAPYYYEIIPSRITSSTCTSSAAYADAANDSSNASHHYQARLYSIYDARNNYAPHEQAL